MDKKLQKRLGFGSALIALLVAVLAIDTKLLAPEHAPWASISLLALFALLAQRETLDLLGKAGLAFPVVGGCLLGALHLLARGAQIAGWDAPSVLGAVPLVLVFAAVSAALASPRTEDGLRRLAGAALGLAPVLGLAALLELAASGGSALVFAVVLTTKCGDIGGYLVGRKWGRTKLIPHVSPGKSYQGCAGGLVLSMGVAVWLLPAAGAELSLPAGLLMGAALYVSGLMGDLIESVLKRAAKEKDSGRLVPEFGGALDMVDSLLLAAPLAVWLLPLLS